MWNEVEVTIVVLGCVQQLEILTMILHNCCFAVICNPYMASNKEVLFPYMESI